MTVGGEARVELEVGAPPSGTVPARRAAEEIIAWRDDPSADDVLLYAAGLAAAVA